MSNETEVIPSMYITFQIHLLPNGDGLNDTFGISGEAIKDFSMRIFNRWGEMVFETPMFLNNGTEHIKDKSAQTGNYCL